jgi:hypothetical protein
MIRVENACTSDFKAVVQVWDKGISPQERVRRSKLNAQGVATDMDFPPDTLVREIELPYPTAMAGATSDLYITDTRYLVVKERPKA